MANTPIANCPVCGYPLDFQPWLSETSPSFEICPCCFTQFGLDDVELNDQLVHEAFRDSKVRAEIHRVLRQKWIEAGSPWRGLSDEKPPNWDPYKQLHGAGLLDETL
jgi:hypothetical protein